MATSSLASELGFLRYSFFKSTVNKQICCYMSDNTHAQNTKLFNEKIISQTPVSRPMTSSGDKAKSVPFVEHQGNLVTTESGSHLIHHGPKFGKDYDGVITDAKNMSKNWKEAGPTVTPTQDTTVGQAMDASQKGGKYSLPMNNCYDSQTKEHIQSQRMREVHYNAGSIFAGTVNFEQRVKIYPQILKYIFDSWLNGKSPYQSNNLKYMHMKYSPEQIIRLHESRFIHCNLYKKSNASQFIYNLLILYQFPIENQRPHKPPKRSKRC